MCDELFVQYISKALGVPTPTICKDCSTISIKDGENVVTGHTSIVRCLVGKCKKPNYVPRPADQVACMYDWIGFVAEFFALMDFTGGDAISARLATLTNELRSKMYLAGPNPSLCDIALVPYLEKILLERVKPEDEASQKAVSSLIRYYNVVCPIVGRPQIAPPKTVFPPFKPMGEGKKKVKK